LVFSVINIAGRQFRTVVESRLGPQQEAISQFVGGNSHAPRHQAVKRIRLIEAPTHQGVEGRVHARGAVALEGVDVKRVERVEVLVATGRAELDDESAALGCLWVHVGEILEILGLREVSEGGKPVGFRFPVAGATRARKSRQRRGKHQPTGVTTC
jgi:hypothetical protein